MKALYSLVGMKHKGETIVQLVKSLPLGEQLVLKRDRDNRFDSRAIEVWARGQHIGFISARENHDLARRFDQSGGESWPALFAYRTGWPAVEVEE